MRYYSLLLPVLASCAHALGDTANAEAAFSTLQDTWYNETTGLWDTSGWWNGANALTAITDLAAVDSNTKSDTIAVIENTYQNAPAYNPSSAVTKSVVNGLQITIYPPLSPKLDLLNTLFKATGEDAAGGNAAGFLDSCYDDNGWWALAWIGAYDLTSERRYLDTAMGIFDNMTGAGPTNCSDGGIIWCAAPAGYYVNAIANELYLSVAASLASRVGWNSSYYQNVAEKQWSWFQNSGMINSEGTINDGLTLDCKNNGNTVFSYNQGVILGGLVELNKVNGDQSLLDSANNIAAAAIANLTDSNHVVHDACEPNCGPDGTQFKGIFIRNLAMLQQASPSDSYKQVIDASANSIWSEDRNDGTGQLSVDWAGPFVNPANSSTHSSALDALVAQIIVG